MRPNIRLLAVSALILFLELALIRYVPATVLLTGYFSNLVLLATFLGLGSGIMLSTSLINLTPWFPFALLTLIEILTYLDLGVDVTARNVLFFRNVQQAENIGIESAFILPLLFLAVTMVFIPLGQFFGTYFSRFKPLTAYSLDIMGAIVGIALFFVCSLLSIPAFVWFGAIVITWFIIWPEKKLTLVTGLSILALITIPVLVYQKDKGSIWSPYYKITVTKADDPTIGPHYVINANNMSHQYVSDYRKREAFYFAPYDYFTHTSYKKILIIGAGSGVDVAAAIGENPELEEIDAVEIDPKMVELGKKYNVNKPYDDPRVNIIIDDGRNFLAKTSKKYDLIIFALTDSLVITGGSANIRLESFLFTKESFELAKEHLTPHGLLTLYNYYRRVWLIDKIASSLHDVFGQSPWVEIYENVGNGAIFLAGPKTADIQPGKFMKQWQIQSEGLSQAVDDWPFIYMRGRMIPVFYLKFLALILLVAGIVIFVTLRLTGAKKLIDWRFFFLGAGFMLLETKSIVIFGLLFGTTWIVNSLVFGAVLLSILLANYTNILGLVKNTKALYVALFAVLLLSLVVKPGVFLGTPSMSRYLFASVFYFSPIFLANLIFSKQFKNSQESTSQLGVNMLGAMVGGIAEYSALVIGYQWLALPIALFYWLSMKRTNRI